MKFRLLLLILLFTKIGYSQIEKLNDYKIANINNVIALFKQKDIDKISTVIKFPLNRDFPIPSIKDEKEFTKRFSEVFDKVLIEKIANSKTKQWSEAGWRGIMLDSGILWIDSTEGKIIAVTYQSDFERKLKKDLIDKEKKNLDVSLKKFDSPIYKIKTKKHLIRIDKISDYKYRYASWRISEKESSKPDIILKNGKWESLGSGGNHVITFTSANYTYRIYRNIIGEDNSPDITLEVEKNGKIILNEDGTLVTI